MNEKIKQLAEQAGLNFGTNISGIELVYGTFEGSVISHIDSEELTKFAELIVRECAGIVGNKIEVSRYVHEAELLRECSATIKLHFGVEE